MHVIVLIFIMLIIFKIWKKMGKLVELKSRCEWNTKCLQISVFSSLIEQSSVTVMA